MKLDDTLKRESFFRELPTIDQLASVVEKAYNQRYQNALSARADAYTQALKTLQSTPGWEELDEDQRQRIAGPLESRGQTSLPQPIPIPELRSDLDACPARLGRAVEELLLLQEGARLVKVNIGSYFSGGIESEEQLTCFIERAARRLLAPPGGGQESVDSVSTTWMLGDSALDETSGLPSMYNKRAISRRSSQSGGAVTCMPSRIEEAQARLPELVSTLVPGEEIRIYARVTSSPPWSPHPREFWPCQPGTAKGIPDHPG